MDVYDLLAASLRLRITISDWKHFTFVDLVNLFDSYMPKEKEQEAGQKDIDWLLE